LNVLEKHNVISMRYSLDLDLVAVRSAQEKYYELLMLPAEKRNVLELTGMRKGIKRIDRIISAFESLETSSWPYSYSRIKKIMTRITRELK
jgi:putative ATP-dependent endonuclease of OLD family